ncbi:unnamed protein product [Arabis nemorensis]|uniref:Uncharacterized protein n=1 Tax=Arabis nemorensis TaxID=586526 RepID=A0A565CQN4_9BRAS|nr:unnamed protein product [Arabis nemorensis]
MIRCFELLVFFMLNVKGNCYSLNIALLFFVAGAVKKIFDKYLLEINKELSYVHFELKACRDQYDGQIAFFKGIIEAIAQDEAAQGCISSFDALNIRLDYQVKS